MKILAVDVGVGTQDMLLYDSTKNIENSIKLVLPSPTRILAKKIRNSENNILITGETMGGGPINKAIKEKLHKGYKIAMTTKAARTVRDDLNRVSGYGIDIIDENNNELDTKKYSKYDKIELKDVDLPAIKNTLINFGVDLNFNYIGVAVQDHGFKEGMGDRNFRFMKIKERLDVPRKTEEFSYFKKVPDYFTRMNAILRYLKQYKVLIMDSKFASICGATCDDYVKGMDRYVAMDVGNGHTLAAAFDNGKIVGVFEHHTHTLTRDKIELFVNKLVEGTLTHEEIHDDGGHGAWVLNAIDDYNCIVATGPQRILLNNTEFNVYNAAPAGDVMMTGPAGLIKAIKTYKLK
ncbi:MAG: DUF1786 domain-containing protein [Methanomicrobiales archaeon]